MNLAGKKSFKLESGLNWLAFNFMESRFDSRDGEG